MSDITTIPDSCGSIPPPDHSPQGLVVTKEDEQELLAALEKAFDYRGDVTVTKLDGSTVEGYLFDRVKGAGLADSYLRIMLPKQVETPGGLTDKRKVPYAEIAQVDFSGKDMAHGRSFDRYVQKFIEKKLAEREAASNEA